MPINTKTDFSKGKIILTELEINAAQDIATDLKKISDSVFFDTSLERSIKRKLKLNSLKDKPKIDAVKFHVYQLLPLVNYKQIPPQSDAEHCEQSLEKEITTMVNNECSAKMDNANTNAKKNIWRQIGVIFSVVVLSILFTILALYVVVDLNKNNVSFQFSLNIAELVAGIIAGIGIFMAGVTYAIKTIDEMNQQSKG